MGKSGALWASEETLIIICDMRNARRALKRSTVCLRWVWAQTNRRMTTGAGNLSFRVIILSFFPLKITE